ncbi:hypothetical protein AURDEDRAFT_155294 [Auricularia subglabra TFB-10046 SS5]|nr:hypothetical protein AURDEDRAFT_155294 [Auricularia subglabra TFB-10046 SS5]
MARKSEPQFLRVPRDHQFYVDVKKRFRRTWMSNGRLPNIARMYLITWPSRMRHTFETYRDRVAKRRHTPRGKAKEFKCFRAERRSCCLGETGKPTLCHKRDCRLCKAIKTGFNSSLQHKREAVQSGSHGGIRFGGGLYMSPESDKAFQYAKNLSRAKYKTVLVTRTVLGRQQHLKRECPRRMSTDRGYDSAMGRADGSSSWEYIVYKRNAVRPAYLLVLK